jgi:hypothetical protein
MIARASDHRGHTQHDPKEPIETTQDELPTFPLQHSDVLAQSEHLQRDIQGIAKKTANAARVARIVSITHPL